MNRIITEKSCRVCLDFCEASEDDYNEMDVENYYICTSFRIRSEDLPKKICADCREFLKTMVQFKDVCALVESRLCQVEPEKTCDYDISSNICDEDPINTGIDMLNIDQLSYEILSDDSEAETVESFAVETSKAPILHCFHCPGRSFLNRRTLKDHMKQHHKSRSEQIYNCLYCSEEFASNKQRKLHTKELHRDQDSRKAVVQCVTCGKFYQNKHTLNQHMERIHIADSFFCDICDDGVPFKGRISIYKHMRAIHVSGTPKRKFPCQVCDKEFNFEKTRSAHFVRYHVAPEDWTEVCSICEPPRFFPSTEALRSHVWRHTKERKFRCATCLRCFGTRAHLRIHIKNIHEELGANWFCAVCGKKFSCEKYLKQHAKVHESIYSCPVCEYERFSFVTSLRKHISKKHPEFPLPRPGTVLKNFDWSSFKLSEYE